MSSLSIVINRLCFRSLWKLNCIVVSVGMMLIGLIVGSYAWVSGADIVSINDNCGFTAFITAIGLIPHFVFGTFWTITQWIGFVIYSRFRPIRLRYYEVN